MRGAISNTVNAIISAGKPSTRRQNITSPVTRERESDAASSVMSVVNHIAKPM